MDATSPTRALATFAAKFDPRKLPDDVREKLGWLLPRLSARRVDRRAAAVERVGDAATSRPSRCRAPRGCCSPRTRSIPQHATFINVTFSLELRRRRHPCRRDAPSRRRDVVGGARDRRACRCVAGRRCSPRWSRATRPSSASGLRCSRATSSAASRAPAPATGSAPRRPAGRLLFRGKDAAERIAEAIGLAGSYPSGVAQFYFSGSSAKRIQAAHAAQCGVAAALLTKNGFTGPADILEGTGGFARAYADGWNPALIEDGLGTRFHLMDVLMKSHAAAARVAAGIDAHAGAAARARLCRLRHREHASRHSAHHPGPPDQQASGRPAGGADVPAVQRRARGEDRAAARPDAGARRRRLRGGARRPRPLRSRGAHHDRPRRRGRGGEQRAVDRGEGERASCATAATSRCWCRPRRAAPANPFTAAEHERASPRNCRAAFRRKPAPRSCAMSKDLDRLDPRWLGRVLGEDPAAGG